MAAVAKRLKPVGAVLTLERGKMLSDVRFPTSEELAEARRQEEECLFRSLIQESNIPKRYQAADLRTCHQDAARYVAELKAGKARNLIITGPANAGKTYTSCAALRAAIRQCLCRGAFVTMEDLLSEIKASYGNYDSEEAVVCRYASKQLLVIDDFGKERLTKWSLPLIWRIINKRYNGCRPTVFTTQYNTDQLAARFSAGGADDEMTQSIIRRMVDPLTDDPESKAIVIKAVRSYA